MSEDIHEKLDQELVNKIQKLYDLLKNRYINDSVINPSHVEEALEFFARQKGSLTVEKENEDNEVFVLGERGDPALGFFKGEIEKVDPSEEENLKIHDEYDEVYVYHLDNADYDFYGTVIHKDGDIVNVLCENRFGE